MANRTLMNFIFILNVFILLTCSIADAAPISVLNAGEDILVRQDGEFEL